MLASTLEEERESDSVLGLLNHVEGRVNFFPNNLYQGYPCQQYTDPFWSILMAHSTFLFVYVLIFHFL